MNDTVRRRLTSRINRISGQVGGVGRMLADDAYCVDILTQIAAARSALDSLGVELLASHIEHCVVGNGGEAHGMVPECPEERMAEVRTALARLCR